MDYYLIKGTFHVVGYSPDGDSLMFKADKKTNWNKVNTAHRELFDQKLKEGKGPVQLRLQGIDALETHYCPAPVPAPKGMGSKTSSKAEKPKMMKCRQPEKYGEMATSTMLQMFGVDPKATVWRRSGWGGAYISSISVVNGKKTKTYKKKNADPLKGYIVVNDMDRKGRPISWVFPGKTKVRDGAKLTTSKLKGMLKQSANYKLVSNGLVYPYFFFTLAASLRNVLRDATLNAQRKKWNIWQDDETAKGLRLKKFSHIQDQHLIFPYLFRRLVKHQYLRMMQEYWAALKSKKSYKPSVEQTFLQTFYHDTNPYVFMVKEAEFKRLDEIVTVTKTTLKMKTNPENIVFLS